MCVCVWARAQGACVCVRVCRHLGPRLVHFSRKPSRYQPKRESQVSLCTRDARNLAFPGATLSHEHPHCKTCPWGQHESWLRTSASDLRVPASCPRMLMVSLLPFPYGSQPLKVGLSPPMPLHMFASCGMFVFGLNVAKLVTMNVGRAGTWAHIRRSGPSLCTVDRMFGRGF